MSAYLRVLVSGKYSPCEKYAVGIILGSKGRKNSINILPVPGKKLPMSADKLSVCVGDMRHVAVSPAGDFAAAWSGRDNRVFLWDILRGHHVIDIAGGNKNGSRAGGERSHVVCVSWSPDGKQLVTLHADTWDRPKPTQLGPHSYGFTHAYRECFLQTRPWRADISYPLDAGARTFRMPLSSPKGSESLEWSSSGSYLAIIEAAPYQGCDYAYVMPASFSSEPVLINCKWLGWSPSGSDAKYAVDNDAIEIVTVDRTQQTFADSVYQHIVRCESSGPQTHFWKSDSSWSPCGTKFVKVSISGWQNCSIFAEVWDTTTGKIVGSLHATEPCQSKTPYLDTFTHRWVLTADGRQAIMIACAMCGSDEERQQVDRDMPQINQIQQDEIEQLYHSPKNRQLRIILGKLAMVFLDLSGEPAPTV